MANLNELMMCYGASKQTNITTPNVSTTYLRLDNLNAKPWAQNPVNEDDSKEIGKGHEFAATLYKSHYDPPIYQLQKYVSSEALAFILTYGLGSVVATTGQYVVTPIVPATLGSLELPYFPFAQQIRPGGSSVLDQLFVGCAVKGWKISYNSSPGRASAMITADLWTTGGYVEPSAVSMPALAALHEINAQSLTCVINGVTYVMSNFLSLEMGMENNPRPGYFPGSGSQDGYQIQARCEIGDRIPSLSFVVRLNHGSTELTSLRALTEGTAVISQTLDANNSIVSTWQQVGFEKVEIGDANGIVTIQVTTIPMYNASNGLFSATIKCPVAGICQ
jgi:hypothetical protein